MNRRIDPMLRADALPSGSDQAITDLSYRWSEHARASVGMDRPAVWQPLRTTIYGTDGDDTLSGTGGRDLIYGYLGDDLIHGNEAQDEIWGGAGDDTAYGGAGNDKLWAESGGVDHLFGDEGDDTFYTARGSQGFLEGGVGLDKLKYDDSWSGSAIDWTNSATGSSQLLGLTVSGIERLYFNLGTGADYVSNTAYAADDKIHGGAGDDTLHGGGGHDKLYGDAGNDVLSVDGNATVYGGAGNDALIGGAGKAILLGDDGNDTVRGGAGNETLSGGLGDDSIVGARSASSRGDYLIGDFGNDTLIGSNGKDRLYDRGGSNELSGGGGNDTLAVISDGTADRWDGGVGIDTLEVSAWLALAPLHWVNDGTTQIIQGNTISGIEQLRMPGTAGNDVIENLATGNDQIDGLAGNDWLKGGWGNDGLMGGAGDDTLDGGEGNDSFQQYLNSGADLILGGAGDDFFGVPFIDGSRDTYDGGAGIDTLANLASGSNPIYLIDDPTLLQELHGDQITGFERYNISGSVGNDTLLGNGDDTFASGEGDDLLRAGHAYGGGGNDTINGLETDDVLIGYGGNDVIDGGAGNDEIGHLYDEGDDWMNGGAGDDWFRFLSGKDTLVGGAGADRFDLRFGGTGRIQDFTQGEDQMRLDLGTASMQGERIDGPGGFAAASNLVIVTGDIDGNISLNTAVAAIGSADASYSASSRGYFVVDNGVNSGVFSFISRDVDAVVSASELTLVATLVGVTDTQLSDYAAWS